MRTSGIPSRAPADAIRASHASASSSPRPPTNPCSAPMTGFSILSIRFSEPCDSATNRRERLALAINYNRADLGTIELVERLGNRPEHRLVNGVSFFGAVQRDIRELTLDPDFYY